MGLFDLAEQTASKDVVTPLQTLPATPGERFEAEFSATFAEDRYFNKNAALRDRAQRVIDTIHGGTGERLTNPYDFAPTPEEMGRLGNQPAVTAERLQKLRDRATALWQAMTPEEGVLRPDALDTDFDAQVARDATSRRQRAAQLAGTGAGWAAFLGSMIGETLTPHGVAGLFLPVTRLPSAASVVIGETFLKNVAREAAFQGGANVGIQAGAEALDYLSRRSLGTEQTASEILMNLGGAALGGFVIGGGVRALHLKWLGLPESVRANAPLAVQDAFRVIEGEALYAGGNRFGLPPDVHASTMQRAADDILRGRPVQASDLWGNADTGMTALGRALRTPDEVRPNITGLWDALDVVGRLPDEEVEAFARQLKPRSFLAHDRLVGEISAARAELDAMNRTLDAVTMADMVDPLTGARLADIDVRLGARALPARERDQLVRERDMIIESVDPDGRLAKELESERAALETEAERTRRTELETRLEKAEAEFALARGEVTREVDFLREKLTRLKTKWQGMAPSAQEVAAEVGVPTLRDLEQAVGRTVRGDAPVIAARERLAETTAPDAPVDPAFTAKVAEEMKRFHKGRALENIMRAENPNDVAIAIQKNDLKPGEVRKIARLYERRIGESPQAAFNRAFNQWSAADQSAAAAVYRRPGPVVEELPDDPAALQRAADQRAQQFLTEEPTKPDDPELVKAMDLEIERVLADPKNIGDKRAAVRELEAADEAVKDARAAAACATGGGAL